MTESQLPSNPSPPRQNRSVNGDERENQRDEPPQGSSSAPYSGNLSSQRRSMLFFNRAILASLHVGGDRSAIHTALDLDCQSLHADASLHGWIDTKAALLRSIAARSTHQEAPAISGYERPLKGNPEHGSSLEKARGRAGKTANPPPNHNLPDRRH